MGLVLGPLARVNRTRDTRFAEPRLPAPEDGRLGEGRRLTPDAPHSGDRPSPPGTAPHTPAARSPSRACKPRGQCWAPTPAHPRPQHVGSGPLTAHPEGGQPGAGKRLSSDAPHDGERHPPVGRPSVTPTARIARTGHASQVDSARPPHPHTRAHSTLRADPNSPPGGRAIGGGGATDLRRPSRRRQAPPPGTPLRHPHSAQHWPARAQAVGPVLGPRARANRTRDGRVAKPWLPAPEDRRLGEGQRLTPDAPHNGDRPSPPGTAPRRPRGAQPPRGMQAKRTVLGPHTRTPTPTACW